MRKENLTSIYEVRVSLFISFKHYLQQKCSRELIFSEEISDIELFNFKVFRLKSELCHRYTL